MNTAPVSKQMRQEILVDIMVRAGVTIPGSEMRHLWRVSPVDTHLKTAEPEKERAEARTRLALSSLTHLFSVPVITIKVSLTRARI